MNISTETKENNHKSDNEELSKELLKKLQNLNVKLQHNVPPQHEGFSLRRMSPDDNELFEVYNTLKKGSYSNKEDAIIKRNWEEFCEIHNWDKENPKPFIFKRANNKFYITKYFQRQRFVQFLANGLDNRSLQSVLHRFRMLYGCCLNKGPFTQTEDMLIMKYAQNASTSGINSIWADVANVLRRDRHAVYTRYQKLKRNYDLDYVIKKINDDTHERTKNSKKIIIKPEKVVHEVNWSSFLVKKFIHYLMKVSSSKNLEDLENMFIDDITWEKVEKELRISRTVLKNFWYFQLHLQLFCPEQISLNELKIKLINFMYTEELTSLEDAEQEILHAIFPGVTIQYLTKLLNYLVYYTQRQAKYFNTQDIYSYLYENHIPELENKLEDAILPKLNYINNQIIYSFNASEIYTHTTSDPIKDEKKKYSFYRR